jgi:hypothetical protein
VPVLRLNKLKGYLQKAMFDKDNGLDVEKIYNLLLESGALIDPPVLKPPAKSRKK